MNKALIILLFFLSSHVYADDVSTWIERSGYTYMAKHKAALDAAKKYAVNETINGSTVHYEYKITENKNGFYVLIIKYTLNNELQKLYYPGGHFAVEVDTNGDVVKFHPGR